MAASKMGTTLTEHILGCQEKILRQRHSIRSIPVHEVSYMYRDQQKCFWVYGLDHQVSWLPRLPLGEGASLTNDSRSIAPTILHDIVGGCVASLSVSTVRECALFCFI